MAGMTGHVAEYTGPAIDALSMEGRMTICNMSVEGGARAGLIAADDTTFAYLEGRPGVPEDWEAAVERWREYRSDDDAVFDREVVVDVAVARAAGLLGHEPRPDAARHGARARPDARRTRSARWPTWASSPARRWRTSRSTASSSAPAPTAASRTCAPPRASSRASASPRGVRAMVVPGSMQVKAQAEAEGLDRVFTAAGFEWRNAGCSMCLGMNPDILEAGERCASTSNRNFEGRQGRGGRTHLMSPEMAAAAAIAGHLVDVRSWS